MVIRNATKNRILSDSAILAKSFKQKVLGLLLAKKSSSMIFETRFGIHTFFMKYPIDILILDRQNKIVALKKKLKPNKIFVWNPKHKTVIELPVGIIERTKTQKEDRIKFNKS